MVQQLDRPAQQALSSSLSIPSEIRGLLYDTEIAAKVLSWDNFSYGKANQYQPEQVKPESITEDIVWYRVPGGMVPISVDQFVYYWEQIKQLESTTMEEIEVSSEEIVSTAKSQGTVIWEHGTKLGYVVQIGSWFYAVTEVLALRGFQYSYSRHGSFYLAHAELVERSWEVEEVA